MTQFLTSDTLAKIVIGVICTVAGLVGGFLLTPKLEGRKLAAKKAFDDAVESERKDKERENPRLNVFKISPGPNSNREWWLKVNPHWMSLVEGSGMKFWVIKGHPEHPIIFEMDTLPNNPNSKNLLQDHTIGGAKKDRRWLIFELEIPTQQEGSLVLLRGETQVCKREEEHLFQG